MPETKVCSSCQRELPLNANYFYRQQRNGKPGFRSKCRECHGSRFIPEDLPVAKEGYCICSKCSRELPMDHNHFYIASKKLNGLESYCRECRGGVFLPYVSEGHKACTRCGQVLPNSEEFFYKQKACKDGLNTQCKGCYSERAKDRYINKREEILAQCKKYKDENREEVRARWRKNSKKYALKHKQYQAEHKDELTQKRKEWRDNHLEHSRAMERKRYAENKPERRKYQLNYYQKNAERLRPMILKNTQKRKARKNKLIATFTEFEWKECQEYFGKRCAYCGKKVDKLSQDHVIPVIKGGEYTASNIIPACIACNDSKATKDFDRWFRSQPFFSESRLKKIYKWTQLKPNSDIQQVSMF